MRFIDKLTPGRTIGLTLLALGFAVSAAHAAPAPKSQYLLTGFTQHTGNELGLGGYQDSTSDSGKQCKTTFRVSEGKAFSITKTTIKGPNAKPRQAFAKDAGDGRGRATPSTQPDGKGWQAVLNALNGMANHDGTWTVILAFPDAASKGCASYDGAARLVLDASF